MPELPEVETVRRGLERLVKGKEIEKALAGDSVCFPEKGMAGKLAVRRFSLTDCGKVCIIRKLKERLGSVKI